MDNKQDNPLRYTGLMFLILVIVVTYIGYTFYYYYSSNVMMQGYSYYNKDITNIQNLFETFGPPYLDVW